jgi:hypothetical protein
MKWKVVSVITACVLLSAGFSLSAEGRARLEYFEGAVFVYSSEDGLSRPAVFGDVLEADDGLVVENGGTATVFFEDGSRMDLSGPCHVRFRLLAEYARTIELLYGTINRLRVNGITTGVFTPAEVYAVVQSGDLFMRAEMVSEPQRTTIWLREGEPAVCGHASRSQVLEVNKPVVFLTTHCCPKPEPVAWAASPAPEGPMVFPPPVPPEEDFRESSYIGRTAR